MFYSGNAIYNYLISKKLTKKMVWASAHMWTLLYADEYKEPKVLCFAKQVSPKEGLEGEFSKDEKNIILVLNRLARQTGLPLFYIRFVASNEPSKTFLFWSSKQKEKPIILSGDEVLLQFQNVGLRLGRQQVGKQINDRASSAFHLWQRQSMGNEVCVTDMDLIQITPDGKIKILFELKRSFISLDTWKPYEKDYPNFIALSKLADKANINFFIVYNVRTKEPVVNDDVSVLKVFEFNHLNHPPVKFIKTVTIEDFFS